MHRIEPFYGWRDFYISANDSASPFYNTQYNEFSYTNKIYNYYIHPQWDEFGSPTLYTKVLYVDYDTKYAIVEMIGEWNDCITNDIMFFKNNVIEPLQKQGVSKFIIIIENVLNFHGDEDCYYEEWFQEISEEQGWICCLNALHHVEDEMQNSELDHYIHFGEDFCDIDWRTQKPIHLFAKIEILVNNQQKLIWC